jgi:hypothetical protein
MGDEPTAMTPAASEQAVFAEAILCDTPEARAAYLNQTCGINSALRLRVEALLRASEHAGDFLEQPPTGLGGNEESRLLASEVSERPGDRIGRYKLLEQIGEGGCGVVYMAEQEEPMRRRVALKIIKLGMDTRSVIARFEAERQALALMDHPNIAKVLDGGATQSGRPYFVMELVRGVRITQFCNEAGFSTEARLRLFVLVCQAIQHAHQKGNHSPRSQTFEHPGYGQRWCACPQGDRLRHREGHRPAADRQDFVHAVPFVHWDARLRQSRASRNEQCGRGHPQRHLQPRRAAL